MEENKENVSEELSPETVWNILEFARAFNGYNEFLTPDSINARMKQVNLNPVSATESKLTAAMKNPAEHEIVLAQISNFFETNSMIYKRLLSYYANMLAFDVTYTSNAKKDAYSTPRYGKALDAVESFLYKFDYKREFRMVVREMLRTDAYFGAFHEMDTRYILQQLPSDYCKITGRWEGGLLFSFNLQWFDQPGVNIDDYPVWFKKKYLEVHRELEKAQLGVNKYNPSLSIDKRGKSNYMMWVDVPPRVGACFKFSPELATRLPYFVPIFNDLILQPTMRALQQNMNMAEASKIIIGEVPMLNKDSKATVKDSIAISPDLLGKFLQLVKSGVSEAVKIASAPLQNFQAIDFDGNSTMYDDYLRTTLATSGVNTNLIFSSNVKPNVIESQLSLNVDEQLLSGLYEQFEEYLSYQINLRVRGFEFYIKFEGTEFSINRQNRFDTAMALFDKGIVLPQKIAASLGMKPSDLRKQMEESGANGFMDLIVRPQHEEQMEIIEVQNKQAEKVQKQQIKSSTSQQSNNNTSTNKGGRPQKKVTELGDDGASSRASGANIERGGRV